MIWGAGWGWGDAGWGAGYGIEVGQWGVRCWLGVWGDWGVWSGWMGALGDVAGGAGVLAGGLRGASCGMEGGLWGAGGWWGVWGSAVGRRGRSAPPSLPRPGPAPGLCPTEARVDWGCPTALL